MDPIEIVTEEVYGNYTLMVRATTGGGAVKGVQRTITFRSMEGGMTFY